jgi:hypothetical protein
MRVWMRRISRRDVELSVCASAGIRVGVVCLRHGGVRVIIVRLGRTGVRVVLVCRVHADETIPIVVAGVSGARVLYVDNMRTVVPGVVHRVPGTRVLKMDGVGVVMTAVVGIICISHVALSFLDLAEAITLQRMFRAVNLELLSA